jgi:hypothetical protein
MVSSTIVPTLRHGRRRDAPQPILALPDPGEAIVALQRVAAGRNERDGARKHRLAEVAIGPGTGDLVKERLLVEWIADSAAQNMLAEHVKRAGARGGRVLRAGFGGFEGRLAFEHFETIGRHEQRF